MSFTQCLYRGIASARDTKELFNIAGGLRASVYIYVSFLPFFYGKKVYFSYLYIVKAFAHCSVVTLFRE